MKTKPFNLEEYLANPSQKVVTRDGRPVRIVCTDRKGTHPVITLVGEDENLVYSYQCDGLLYPCISKNETDLFFLDESEELTEFEKGLYHIYDLAQVRTRDAFVKECASIILDIARNELESEKPSIIEDLKKYISSTSHEQREKDWQDIVDWYNSTFSKDDSEDEKIRKALINTFRYSLPNNQSPYLIDISNESIVNWLEKQQHDDKKWIYEDEYQKNLDRLYEDGKDEVLNSLEKYGLQKKCEWSEGDYEFINSIISRLMELYRNENDESIEREISKEIDWLKELQNRFVLTKQEPINEDEENMSNFQKCLVKMMKYEACHGMKAAINQFSCLAEQIAIKESKQYWSVEDNRALNDAIVALSVYANGGIPSILPSILLEDVERLKSLCVQPKQGWSETDYACYEIIESCLEEYLTEEYNKEYVLDWFRYSVNPNLWRNIDEKSIPSREFVMNVWTLGNEWKDITKGVCSTEHGTQLEYIQKHWKEGDYYEKIKSQPHWKPTSEQMRRLNNAIGICKGVNEHTDAKYLQELFDQLVKLLEK